MSGESDQNMYANESPGTQVTESADPVLNKKSIYNSITRMSFWTSVVLWLVLLSALLSFAGQIKLFTYPATRRTIKMDKDTGEKIIDAFKTYGTAGFREKFSSTWNTTLTERSAEVWTDEHYSKLQSVVLEQGYCYPVIYDTTGQWKASDVSPVCNCLTNSLVQYRVQMRTLISSKPGIDSGSFERQRGAFVDYISNACLTNTRGTVVEDSIRASLMSSNVVLLVALWNTVGCVVALFRMTPCFDSKIEKGKFLWNMQLGWEGLFFVLAFLVLAFHVPIIIAAYYTSTDNLGAWVAFIFAAIFSFTMLIWQGIWGRFNESEPWSFRENVVFWFGLVISLAAMTLCNNMLVQARDEMYNFMMVTLAILVVIMGYRGDYVHVDAETSDKVDRHAQRGYLFNWLSTVAILYFAFGSTHIRAPVEVFSNAGRVATLCLQLMLTIPFLQVGGFGMKYSKPSYEANKYPIFNIRVVIELVARVIFTMAVVTDLAGAGGMRDFIEVRDMN